MSRAVAISQAVFTGEGIPSNLSNDLSNFSRTHVSHKFLAHLSFLVLVAVAVMVMITAMPAGAQSLQIATGSLPAVQQGSAYSQTFAATGGTAPYTWSISSGVPPVGVAL